MPHPIRLLPLLSSLLLPLAVQAANVAVTVTDVNGKPANDAVVMLEPTGGKPAVKAAAQVDISQAKRTFTPRVSVIPVGTPVNFPNFDTVRHHVYSFSPAKVFELKLYAGVPAKPIVFDKPGVVILGCNIHDMMAAWVVVTDTPYYGLAGADGKISVANVPPGSYRMRVWHPAMPINTEAPATTITVGASDLQQAAKLALSASP